PRSHGAAAAPDLVGVAPHQVDVLDRDPELLAGQHGPRGGVALAVGRRAGTQLDLAIGQHLDRAVLASGDAVGDLYVHRQTQAELFHVTVGPPPLPFLPDP